jgi:hypothetical protein
MILTLTVLVLILVPILALAIENRRPEIKLVQCDVCPEMCKPDGWHLEPVPEGLGGRRHNVHMYRYHAKKPVIQGNYHEIQARKREREFARIQHEIMSIPVGEEFIESLTNSNNVVR